MIILEGVYSFRGHLTSHTEQSHDMNQCMADATGQEDLVENIICINYTTHCFVLNTLTSQKTT